MNEILGVTLLGRESEGPVDIVIEGEHIAALRPSATAPARRRLAMPALANAHDHCRPLSPTSFGGADKPLELWLLRLAAMPAIDPYLGALAAFGRAARGGAGSVMAHYTRFHTPEDPVAEARALARAAAQVGVRVTLAVFMRDRNPIVYGASEDLLEKLPAPSRAALVEIFRRPDADARPSRSPASRPSPRPSKARASLFNSAPTDRNGARTSSCRRSPRPAPARGGACTCISWRRSISAPSPTATIPKGSRRGWSGSVCCRRG